MDKTKIKYVCAELLMLLACGVAAGAAFAVQMIAREPVASDASSMFYVEAYNYNPVAYIAGWLLYIGFLLAAFKFFTDRVKVPQKSGAVFKIVGIIIALVLAICMFLGFIAEVFLFLGMAIKMRPAIMLQLSVFEMPALALALMICIIFRRKRA